ncbi:hypothetical protein BOSEA31B_20576 [Hyphomicrobiales bacterium]|nr:hypothetical protein BOSEA31B_20576 [Hyphomicrobiales bacterium]CAH1702933.1 hypothetical protein BOSEA1005_30805 [Hyphomicrobiales bacterium]CAI0347118.1 hypothetical protein BO1005MUT1_530294 [Hyphomicrobiales bacterium]
MNNAALRGIKATAGILAPISALVTLIVWVEGDVRERAIYAVMGIAVFVLGLVAYFVMAASRPDEVYEIVDDRRRRPSGPSSTRGYSSSSTVGCDSAAAMTMVSYGGGCSDGGSSASDGGSCGDAG